MYVAAPLCSHYLKRFN